MVNEISNININYDFRTDSNGGDPDSQSATLRYYHKHLWTKALPNGELFCLDDKKEDAYLYCKALLDEYFLSSDVITHSYCKWVRMKHIIEKTPKDEIIEFFNAGCTIGSYIIFPGNRINNLPTINQERGCNKKINDRFDLTLECIRRYYIGEENPLSETFTRYDNYFKLFKDFKGFCDFFLLNDIVSDDYTTVKFFLPFDGFIYNPLPSDVAEYLIYKNNSVEFVKNRNNRIHKFVLKAEKSI